MSADGFPEFAEAISNALTTAETVNETALGGIDNTNWEDGIRLLLLLRDTTDLLHSVEASLTRHVYLTGEHGQQTIEGVGAVTIARGRDRKKWDERGVVRAVLDHHMNQTGGVVPDDPWTVAEWLLEVLGVGYCRVTPLRGMGLDPDDFCESQPGRVGVQLPPR